MVVKTIFHSLTLIEYSLISENEVVMIYHIKDWKNMNLTFTDINIKIIY